MFELSNVKYKDIVSIDALKIEEGKITAVIGKSGGGKSTLLKLLNKMLSPSEGTIYYRDEPLSRLPSVAHRRKVLYLNQDPHIFEGSIRFNLVQGFRYQGRGIPDDATLIEMLRRVHLELPLDKPASTLSGGEAQRLALARLLLLDGAVYLFDEPSSALDEKSERDVLNTVIEWLRSLGKTVVMVTHSKDVALKHADVIYSVQDGMIEEVDHE
ncbi:MAG: ATP-binding cassette domain-containing protein [Candidatus Izemoplasmataceae bacterium]